MRIDLIRETVMENAVRNIAIVSLSSGLEPEMARV